MFIRYAKRAGELALFFLATKVSAIVPWAISINTNNIVVVTNAAYGAVGDGVTTNTTAIQNAINKAATGGTTNGSPGGTVEIPPGVYLSGPLTLASSVNLQIDAGAILRMLPIDMYPGGTTSPANFISGSGLHDIAISGPGAIDGQGSPWWQSFGTNAAVNRPSMISLGSGTRVLVQNITLSNSPMFHIAISGVKSGTVQGVIVRAPPSSGVPIPSHNTDACDVSGTNILVQNCDISTGDDDYTCGGGTHDVLLTNNVYGNGHGISIGSYTDNGGVSNLMVINCTMNGTQGGLRIKSDAGRGGLVQNISYLNITMNNVAIPIQCYGYYLSVGTPSSVTAGQAAGQALAAVTGTTPIFRNITYSNITGSAVSGYPLGIIWARTELPATNLVFNKVNLTADRNFCLYNVNGAQFIDCNLQPLPGNRTFAMFNAQAIITNSTPASKLVTFDGLTTNGYSSWVALYNAPGSLQNTNLFDNGPLTLAASTFTVSNNLTLMPSTVLNFVLGTSPAKLAVTGNLQLGGTINLLAGVGFTSGTYTLMSYGGGLSGSVPTLGSIPTGYNGSFDTSTAGVVKLLVTAANGLPSAPANLLATGSNALITLTWSPAATATNYNVKRALISGGAYTTIASTAATNFSDSQVTNGLAYYYVISGVNTIGEGANSTEAMATAGLPVPLAPTNLIASAGNAFVTLTWSTCVTATNYNLKRSTVSGGAYTTLTSTAATNYSDAQVTNGTTYYYVVSAVNATGEGPNGPQVNATPQSQSTGSQPGMVFTDTFANSTVNATSPTPPTPTNTSYEVISSKSWSPNPSITAGHLHFGIVGTTSGGGQVQALFATTPVKLATIGDSLSLLVTFTNTSGLLTQSGTLGFGLYASGQNYPVPGGMNGTETGAATNAIGYAQTWIGYVGQVAFSGANSQIQTRASQIGTLNNNQDLIGAGGTPSYSNPSGSLVGTASTSPSLTLTAGSPYTEVLTIKLSATNTLAITNSFYGGVNTNGTLLSQFGCVASGSTFLTNSFDALALGWRAMANTTATEIDLNKIVIAASLAANQPALPSAPTNFTATATNLLINLKWNSVPGATSYNLKRGTANGGPYPTVVSGLVATNFADASVASSVNYFYVVTVVGPGGESSNSVQVIAAPLPSSQPTNLAWHTGSGQLQLSWPPDHLGWRLQIQTNPLPNGLGTNWVTVPYSTNVTATNLLINPLNNSVFLRLIYP